MAMETSAEINPDTPTFACAALWSVGWREGLRRTKRCPPIQWGGWSADGLPEQATQRGCGLRAEGSSGANGVMSGGSLIEVRPVKDLNQRKSEGGCQLWCCAAVDFCLAAFIAGDIALRFANQFSDLGLSEVQGDSCIF